MSITTTSYDRIPKFLPHDGNNRIKIFKRKRNIIFQNVTIPHHTLRNPISQLPDMLKKNKITPTHLPFPSTYPHFTPLIRRHDIFRQTFR